MSARGCGRTWAEGRHRKVQQGQVVAWAIHFTHAGANVLCDYFGLGEDMAGLIIEAAEARWRELQAGATPATGI